MSFVGERERNEETINAEKLQKVIDRLITPYIKSVDRSHAPSKEDDTGSFHALAGRRVVTRDGRTVSLLFDMWHGDEGDTTNVLHEVLISSWWLRFGEATKDQRHFRLTRAALLGLWADRDFLRSLDLPGATPASPDKPFRDWDGMIANCEAIVAQADTKPGEARS